MSIGQVLMILWRRSWIAALAFLATMLVAEGVLLFTPGRYDAVATASIDPGTVNPITQSQTADFTGIMQGNLVQLVTSQRVALDVVRRLNLAANSSWQASYRKSDSFGRESIEDWLAASMAKNVKPGFTFGTDVLSIKYSSNDPNQAALIANGFLAATIDATIAMKASSAQQTASWFAPQLDELRKELEATRAEVVKFQAEANIVAPTAGGDSETSELETINHNLSSAKALLGFLQSRSSNMDGDLPTDSSDPDLQEVNTLKDRLSHLEASIASDKSSLGLNNPKVAAQESVAASIRKQIPGATDKAKEKMRTHLKERIAQTQGQIALLETAQAAAQKALIGSQPRRDRLNELQHDVMIRQDRLSALEKVAAQARLQSKLTFADITVLDKAVPPIAPAFPKPTQVILVAVGAGLALGLILSLLAEMTDRRVRFPIDLEFATGARLLGMIPRARL